MPTSGNNQRLIYFGNERLATGVTTTAPVLRVLLGEGYDISAVVVHDTHTRSRNTRELEVATVAHEHNIPILSPEKPADILETLAGYQAAAGILVAYGKIIPASLITLFPSGIINVHPSLLPKHRGPTPIESTMLAGETETGVSIMKISQHMDAGPVFAQSSIPLSGTETKQTLADNLGQRAATMLREQLSGILDGSIAAHPQDDGQATYDQLITKQSGLLDVTKPAGVLEREIRAFAGWPGSRLLLDNLDIIITQASLAEKSPENPAQKILFASSKQLYLQTGNGVLLIHALKPAGKPEMAAQAFLAGYSKNL